MRLLGNVFPFSDQVLDGHLDPAFFQSCAQGSFQPFEEYVLALNTSRETRYRADRRKGDIIGRIRKSETPALLHAEYEWVLRELRGQLDGSVEELIVDDRDLHKRLKKALPVLHPEFKGELKLHKSSRPLLQAHGVGAV